MEKTTYGGALRFELLTKYYSGDQIRRKRWRDMSQVWRRGEMHTVSWWERERGHLEDPGVDGRIIHIKIDL